MSENNNNNNNGSGSQCSSEDNKMDRRKLNEIWFDAIQRNGGTPSSPSNSDDQGSESSEDQQQQQQQEKQSKTHHHHSHAKSSHDNSNNSSSHSRKRKTPSPPTKEEQDASNNCDNNAKRQRQDQFRRGYMSDDEGPYRTSESSEENLKWSDEDYRGQEKGATPVAPTEERTVAPTKVTASTTQTDNTMSTLTESSSSNNHEASNNHNTISSSDIKEKPAEKVQFIDERKKQAQEQIQQTQQEDKTNDVPDLYNSESQVISESIDSTTNTNTTENKKPKKKVDVKRLTRNAREKERSNKISYQFDNLRNILTEAGIVVPKGTKNTVLSVTLDYIRKMQDSQARMERDNGMLQQQIQSISTGAVGDAAAKTIQHVAAKQGLAIQGDGKVTSVPNAAQTPPPQTQVTSNSETADSFDPLTSVDEHHYSTIFRHVPVGMAVASLGGSFLDCNDFFCRLVKYSRDAIRDLNIFNLLRKQDLHNAFDQISQLLQQQPSRSDGSSAPVSLTFTLQIPFDNNNEMGMNVELVRDPTTNDGKYLVVTLIHPDHHAEQSSNDGKMIMPVVLPSIPRSQADVMMTKERQAEESEGRKEPVFTVG